jgi:hypothetical protein
MAWTNAAYESEATAAARLTMARAFKGEIMGAISADIAKDGASRSSASLNELLKQVNADITRLERDPGLRRAGGMSLGRLGYRE